MPAGHPAKAPMEKKQMREVDPKLVVVLQRESEYMFGGNDCPSYELCVNMTPAWKVRWFVPQFVPWFAPWFAQRLAQQLVQQLAWRQPMLQNASQPEDGRLVEAFQREGSV